MSVEAELLNWFIKRLPDGYKYDLEHRFYGAVIDLWVESPSEVWIVEAEKVGDHKPLGQLLYYGYLYESNSITKPFKLILVYRDEAAYTKGLFGHYGIRLEKPDHDARFWK